MAKGNRVREKGLRNHIRVSSRGDGWVKESDADVPVSVASNVAEGQGRATAGEFHQFLGHARGSLYELETQIVIASELGYVSAEQRDSSLCEAGELGRILNGLMSSVKPSRRLASQPLF